MDAAVSPSSGKTGAQPARLDDPTTAGMSTTDGALGDMTIRVKTPNTGMTVFGRYKLVRVLGRGGMGVVWLADDLKLERPVALKFLPSLVGIDPGAVKDLKTETRRGLELSHPNIVRIYDFVDDEDSVAISMEYVEGKTLSELRAHSSTGVFTAEEISRWLVGVCDALDYAHFQRRLIHRDLKPSNIMLCGVDSIAKIADFGIARTFSDTMSRLSVTQASTSGTLPYMSPQQAMGERPQPTDDVYSLGATVYELFTGKPPFYRGDVSTQIHSKVPPAITERRLELEISGCESVPKVWEEAIALCLSKDPALRPQSAGAFAAMLGLKPLATGTTLPTNFSAKTMTATTAPKSSKMLLYATAAAVVVFGGAAVIMYSGGKEAPIPPLPKSAELKIPSAPPPAPRPAVSAPTPQTVESTPAAPAPQAPATIAATPASPAGSMPPAVVGEPAATNAPSAASTAPGTDNAAGPTAAVPATGMVPPLAMVQVPVTEPPNGFWTVDQMFPVPPQSAYSENGRRHLLFEAQQLLKEKGLYNSTIDGKEGKGTHNAIVLFQAKSGLSPSGLLDGPTLAAMSLASEPDTPEWKSPVSSSSVRRSYSSKEDPNFFQRAGKSIGRLFKRD